MLQPITLPDPVISPVQWEQSVKALLLQTPELTAMKNIFAKDYVVKSVFSVAKGLHVYGDLAAVMALLPQSVAAFKEIEEDETPNKEKIIRYCKARNLSQEKIDRVIHLASPHGYKDIGRYLMAADREAAAGSVKSAMPTPAATKMDIQADIAQADAILGPKKPVKRPVINPGNWTHNIAKLNGFYESIRGTFEKHKVPHNLRSRCIHTPLGVQSIHETASSPLDCEIKVKAFVEKSFPIRSEKPNVPPTPGKRTWSALSMTGAQAKNAAFNHFKRELKPLKTIVYIEDDEKAALQGLTTAAHIAKFGIQKTCDAFDLYLDSLKEGSRPTVTPQENVAQSEQPAAAAHIADYMKTTTTMGGIALFDLHKELNRPYHASAMFDVPPDQRAPRGARGVKPGAVRNRINKLFGMESVGWHFRAHANSVVRYSEETKQKTDKDTGEIKETVWYTAHVEMFIFEYRVARADGSEEWLSVTPLSDVHSNTRRRAAYTGAMGSLLKQAVRSMGGFDFLDSSPSEKPREQAVQNSGPATQDRPRAAEATKPTESGSTTDTGSHGLGGADIKELMSRADTHGIPRSQVITILGIKDWKEWDAGLEAAWDKVKVQAV